jgi:GT2 family glycosyltransferase
MAKRKTWELLNGFDPNTFLYYEENILFEKIKNLKLKTAILTNVTAIHLGAKSTKEIKNTFLLSIELKSLRYYLKTYRNLNAISTFFITIARHIQISLVNLNNQMKGEKNNN